MTSLTPLIDICKDHKVFIQTHNFPDADAISSAFALYEILNHFGISAKICCAGQMDRLSSAKLSELISVKIYQEHELNDIMAADDYIICVDSQKSAGNITDFIGDEVACIDHHPTYKVVEYKFKQVEIVGACATLMTEHFRNMGIVPSELAATALLYGLKMDTMHFTRGVTPRDIEAFSYLFPLANPDHIRRLETNNLIFNDLKAYGSAIKNVHIYGNIGFSKIPFACPDGLIAALSDFMLSLEEVDVSIIYSIRENGVKFSVRSLIPSLSAGILTHKALDGLGSGGGHASMAGGFIPVKNLLSLDEDYLDSMIEQRFTETLAAMQLG